MLSSMISKFSFNDMPNATLACSAQDLPKRQTYSVCDVSRVASEASSDARTPERQTLPKGTSFEFFNSIFWAALKKALSFGFEAGKPPSTKSMPNASKWLRTSSLSSLEKETPSV